MIEEAVLKLLARLLIDQRVAALGTVRDGHPYVSMVPFAAEPDLAGVLIHVSRLALHAAPLADEPRCGLLIAEPDSGVGDPAQLPRLSLQCRASLVAKEGPDYAAARDMYLAKHPQAEQTFGLGDFQLYRLAPRAGRFVAGFGKVYNVSAGTLREASRLVGG